MAEDRYLILGLARARTTWFSEVAHWSVESLISAEFSKCISPTEVRTRLTTTGTVSVLLLDAGATGVDRDLIAAATAVSATVIVVEDERTPRDWVALGAATVLPRRFGPDLLMQEVITHARPAVSLRTSAATAPDDEIPTFTGNLVAVCGSGGTGSSTIAAGIAQGLAHRVDGRGQVLLADLALNGGLAVLHDARDVVPGLQELVDAHRSARPDQTAIRASMFQVESRGYALLLGLRRRRDWTALASRSTDAAIESLRATYRWTVADTTGDVDGEAETGSIDLEERNHLARTTARQAAAVVVVGTPGVSGTRHQIRLIDDLLHHGVSSDRIVPIINRAPRSRASRAELTRTFAALIDHRLPMSPTFIRERSSLESAHHTVDRLPDALASVVTGAVIAVANRAATAIVPAEPQRLVVR